LREATSRSIHPASIEGKSGIQAHLKFKIAPKFPMKQTAQNFPLTTYKTKVP